MVEWIIAAILLLILIFLIKCRIRLDIIIDMKKVIFEWEHGKEDSHAPRRQGDITTIYEDAKWEYSSRLAGRNFRKEKLKEDIKAERIKRDILDKKADKKYRADERRDSWESMRKSLSRIVGAGKRKKD